MGSAEKPLTTVVHQITPVYDKYSRILILGSLPSPKSRQFGFFYGHPQNIFWPNLAQTLNKPEPPATIAGRKEFALTNKIALWDVLAQADIYGADDSSIANATANDFRPILAESDIQAIFTTGKAAYKYYCQLAEPTTKRPAIYLPSTSPANRAQHHQESFHLAWRQILEYL